MFEAFQHKPPAEHHAHVQPLSVYVGVGSALFLLTGVTVATAQVDLGGPINLIIAMAIAMTKGTLVVLFFMHLLYDNKFYAFIFSVSLLMLTVFIVFTMFDTLRRDGIYEQRAPPIQSEARIYKDLRKVAAASSDQTGHTETIPAH